MGFPVSKHTSISASLSPPSLSIATENPLTSGHRLVTRLHTDHTMTGSTQDTEEDDKGEVTLPLFDLSLLTLSLHATPHSSSVSFLCPFKDDRRWSSHLSLNLTAILSPFTAVCMRPLCLEDTCVSVSGRRMQCLLTSGSASSASGW